jgi:hypothetical protein
MLQCYATPCLFGAETSRRVEVKVVIDCACQVPTEDVIPDENIEG